MANVAQISGFVLDKNLNGGFMPSSIECCTVTGDNVALAKGDIVKLSGGSDARGRPVVAQIAAGSAATGQTPFGVVTGIAPAIGDAQFVNYRVASTARVLHVCVDPNAIYACNAHGTGLTSTASVGCTANVYVGAVNTVFGRSGMEVDGGDVSSSAAATLPLRIVGILDNPLNADLAAGALTNVRALVKLNGSSITALGVIGV